MKRKLTCLLVALAATGALSFSSMVIAKSMNVQSSSKKVPEKVNFVLKSDESEFKFISGKRYKLIIPIKDIKSVLAFSSRGSHELKPEIFAKIIHGGKNSFDRLEPNAAISWYDSDRQKFKHRAEAFTISDYKKTDNNIVYTLHLLSDGGNLPSNISGSIVLFIDDITLPTDAAQSVVESFFYNY